MKLIKSHLSGMKNLLVIILESIFVAALLDCHRSLPWVPKTISFVCSNERTYWTQQKNQSTRQKFFRLLHRRKLNPWEGLDAMFKNTPKNSSKAEAMFLIQIWWIFKNYVISVHNVQSTVYKMKWMNLCQVHDFSIICSCIWMYLWFAF